MLLTEVQPLLLSIKGVTFASLDAICQPKPGIELRVTGEQVLLYQGKNVSGYEQKVRRALEKVGRDPNSFTLGDLPWGVHTDIPAVIEHKGRYYLQCIVHHGGEYHYFIGDKEVQPQDYKIYPRTVEHGVYVHTYRLENITSIRLMGETIGERIEGTLKLKL